MFKLIEQMAHSAYVAKMGSKTHYLCYFGELRRIQLNEIEAHVTALAVERYARCYLAGVVLDKLYPIDKPWAEALADCMDDVEYDTNGDLEFVLALPLNGWVTKVLSRI